jgi:type II secretory pathway pseudopilin PulG
VVILVSQGFFSKARESALDVDLHSIKTAVDTYAIQSGKWPTANSSLPPTGQYAPIDFNASFDKDGKTMIFYPHFISSLPRHFDEGVWRIDSAALVSIDMDRDKY